MKKLFSYSLAFLLLFPCLLCAKSIMVSETQASGDILSSPELLYLTDVLREEAVHALPSYQDWTVMNRESSAGTTNADYKVQAQISKFGSSLVVSTEMHESSSNTLVASYTGKGATVEDIERIFREQSPAFFQKLIELNANNASSATNDGAAALGVVVPPQEQANVFPAASDSVAASAATQDSTVATVSDTAAQVPTATSNVVADSTQPKPEVAATAAKDTTKATPEVKEAKEEKQAEAKTEQNKPKRIWGGVTVGVTYNDFLDTKFGLNNIPQGDDYSVTVEGADKLLDNFWGIGFRAGFSGLFVASPFFSLRGDLNIALRQGTGKATASAILSWDDEDYEDYDDEKNDLKIEYSATQLNIDLPLLARISIPNAVYFEAGPMFSFNVYSKSKSTVKEYHGSKTFEEKGGLKAFEFDIATGIGVSRHIGKSMLDFDLRLVIGMTRISDSKDSPKTWQGQLNITYWFL